MYLPTQLPSFDFMFLNPFSYLALLFYLALTGDPLLNEKLVQVLVLSLLLIILNHSNHIENYFKF